MTEIYRRSYRGSVPGFGDVVKAGQGGYKAQYGGRGIVPGRVVAEALVSQEPISGWGGIDPTKGTIVEARHQLQGQCFTDMILVFPSAKGSSGWSGFFQATRLLNTAPAGMVFNTLSTKAVLGAVVTRVPTVAEVGAAALQQIQTGDLVEVDGEAGVVRLLSQ